MRKVYSDGNLRDATPAEEIEIDAREQEWLSKAADRAAIGDDPTVDEILEFLLSVAPPSAELTAIKTRRQAAKNAR